MGRIGRWLIGFALVVSWPVAVRASEVWVVAEQSARIHVIETQSLAVASFALPPLSGSPPSGLAFATVEGVAGRYAFIARGKDLLVLDADTHSLVKTIDLESLTTVGMQATDLASSPNRWIGDRARPTIEAFLFVAGNADRTGNPEPEPYYVVLDQRAILGVKPPGSPLVVAHGFVHSSSIPVAERGSGVGVGTIGSAAGEAHIRAWVTIRDRGATETIHVARVSRGSALDSSWSVDEVLTRPLPPGASAAPYFATAAPHDHELVVLPTGGGGSVVNIHQGGSCEFSFDLGAVALAGPGVGGHQIDAIDLTNERLVRVNEHSCNHQLFPVGRGPVDVTNDGGARHGSVFVANRDSDDVTLVRRDGSVATVPLIRPHDGECVECPVRIRTRISAGTACTREIQVAKLTTGEAEILEERFGCAGASTSVMCRCRAWDPRPCLCECDPVNDPDCYGSLPLPSAAGQLLGTQGAVGALSSAFLEYDPGGDPEDPWIDLGHDPRPAGGTFGTLSWPP